MTTPSPHATPTPIKAFPLLSLTLTLLTLGGLWWLCGYGFDFTDDSFYIESIRAPFAYTESVTQFGPVYHPLFNGLGQNIVSIRQVVMLLTMALGTWVSYRFLGVIQHRQSQGNSPPLYNQVLLAAGLGCSALLYAHAWLITPNYNILCLQGVLLTLLGLLHTEQPKNNKAKWLVPCVLIGTGGVITFLAKISSAAVLAVVCLFYGAVRPAVKWQHLAGSALVALILVILSAFLIGGSLAGFASRMGDGLALLQVAKTNHSLWDLLQPDPLRLPHLLPLWLLGLTALGGMVGRSLAAQQKVSRQWVSVYAAVVLALSVSCFVGFGKALAFSTKMAGALFWAAPITCALLGLWLTKQPNGIHPLKRQWPLLLLCFVLPCVFSFGTGDNMWHHNIAASIFLALAGIAFVAHHPRLIWHGVIVSQVLTLLVLSVAWVYPYRQPGPLWSNTATLTLLGSNSQLMVHPNWVTYQQQLRAIATPQGWQAGTPLLDLTGHSTGAITLLGGNPVGHPWMIGGYPGSEPLATAMLKRPTCTQLARAWVLVEPNGPRKLSSTHLAEFGAALNTHYHLAGTLHTPPYAGGISQPRQQFLYRPTASAHVLAACNTIRARANTTLQ